MRTWGMSVVVPSAGKRSYEYNFDNNVAGEGTAGAVNGMRPDNLDRYACSRRSLEWDDMRCRYAADR